MKPTIFCIVGTSGSGKTTAAEYIEKEHGIHMIQSYTDRPPRTPNENGHVFLTPQQFSMIPESSMIAYTTYGNYHYCCVHKDVKEQNTYVIDESGLEYLRNNFSEFYNIFAIFINRNEDLRLKSGVTKERMSRDHGKYIKRRQYLYDVFIENNKDFGLFYYNIDIALKKAKLINRTKPITYYL